MQRKHKKISIRDLSNRLENDENAWLKQLSSMGDFARYWRLLEAQLKRQKRSIARLQKRVLHLEQNANCTEGSKPDDVAKG